jgi:ribonucleotide monophosphatase NagD (HAD superfamily)
MNSIAKEMAEVGI